MKSLIVLEEAILAENFTGIAEFLNTIDPHTCNERMRLLCENMGLVSMEIHGICYAHLGRTSEVFGYSSVSGLRMLMERYQIWTPKIGSFALEVQKIVRETFDLDTRDGQATFISFHGMLLGAMRGETPGAGKIKLYLLKCENALWEGVKTVDQFKLEAHRLRRIEKTIALASKLSHMPDSPYKDAAVEAFEQLTGKTFDRPKQKNLFDC